MAPGPKKEDDHEDEGAEDTLLSEEPDLSSTHEMENPEELEHDQKLINETEATTELEKAQRAVLSRQKAQIERLTTEVSKLKSFISKRKQTYKRKRKDNGAPTRALSAYNLFVRERFAKLAKDNNAALHSDDLNVHLKRVPPSSLVASTGEAWKSLPAEEKRRYEEAAASDKKRYEGQMQNYTPPEQDKETRKRNKTGYNMFFSAYVNQLKQTAAGVPPERGSVARLVGKAWKELTSEEKQYYETEAEKRNEFLGLDNSRGGGGGGGNAPNIKTEEVAAPKMPMPPGPPQAEDWPPPPGPPPNAAANSPQNMQQHQYQGHPSHGPPHPHQGPPPPHGGHYDGYGYGPPGHFPSYYGAPPPPQQRMPPPQAPYPPGPYDHHQGYHMAPEAKV